MRYLYYFLISICCVHGQKKYPLKHLGINDGLSQSSVIAIEQDRHGQLWFGTRDGLNKYDGTNFTVYRRNPNDSKSISNNDIVCIEEDHQGNLWVGTYQGLNKYDPVKETFEHYLYSENPNSISNNTIWDIKEMSNGDLWLATPEGISIYKPEDRTFVRVRIDENTSGEPPKEVIHIEQANDGSIWVASETALYKLEKEVNGYYQFRHFPTSEPHIPFRAQKMLFMDETQIYLATRKYGLVIFDRKTEKFTSFEWPPDISKKPEDIRSLTMDKEKNVWVGTASGIYIISPEGTVTILSEDTKNVDGLSDNRIKSLFTDKKGSVWAGTYFRGIFMWDDANANFINYSSSSNEYDFGNNVIGALETYQGTICVGTEDGAIFLIDNNAGETSPRPLNNCHESMIGTVKSLLNHNNQLWIGTLNKGPLVYDWKKQSISNTVFSSELLDFLGSWGIYDIKKGPGNTYWIATFGKGLVLYDADQKSFRVFQHDPKNENTLSSDFIRCLFPENDHRLWIGTLQGVSLLELSETQGKEKVTRYLYDREILPGFDVQTIFKDSKERLWVGAKGEGLLAYGKSGFKKVSLEVDPNITSIQAILEDDHSNLWMSSNGGIIKYGPDTQTVEVYNQGDGIIGNEFNGQSALKGENGFLYFGGILGLTGFKPFDLTKNDYAPQVILTGLKMKNQFVRPTDSLKILSKAIQYTDAISIAHDNANFAINYALPNFVNPEKNKYRYRMVGLEESWNETQDTQANYTLQKPGDYSFEVLGSNNDGMWNSNPTVLDITVKPAPWRSGWAIFLYVLLLTLGLLGLAIMIRSRTKLKQQLYLEHMENEQIKKLNKSKLEFFTNISHEFRTPLTLITGPLQQLLEDYKGSSFVYKKLLVMESSANQLLQLINRLMDFRKFENKQYQLKTAKGNFLKFFNEIYLSFTEFAKLGNYDYRLETDADEVLLYYDRPKLEKVFYNLISNAFKYTPENGRIILRVKEEADYVTIEVDDSGPGIPDKYIGKVFDRFFEVPERSDENANKKGTGIGLAIAKNIVELHKGNISILPKATQGAIFSVQLPKGKAHLSEEEIIDDFKYSEDIRLYTSQLKEYQQNNKYLGFDTLANTIEAGKPKVLIVEDNTPLRNFIRDFIKDKYHVLEAENGEEGYQMTLSHLPNLVVSDVIMPKMVGTELCAKIKNNINTSHIPVVLLTSRTSLVYKFEGFESGADDYISKPFNIKEFRLRINNLIEASKKLQEKFSSEKNFVPNDMAISSSDEKLLEKALKIVNDNISNDQFDIHMFASELGVSRTLLFTKIKAWTNFTPNDFVKEIRLKRAAQLLEQQKFNISEVGYKVGYRNPKYFSKTFAKRYGKTPTQYAKTFSVGQD